VLRAIGFADYCQQVSPAELALIVQHRVQSWLLV
jgi:hypothetical protein